MRIYLPAVLTELSQINVLADGQASMTIAARRAHAVTSALNLANPDEDQEGLEFSALLAAADDDLALLAQNPDAPALRLILTLEVPDAVVSSASDDVAVLDPSAVEVAGTDAVVVCAHVDEPEAAADVRGTIDGDDGAAERLIDRDLLWYDTSELGDIPTE